MRIGIVADDLTGAADSVAPFAMRGLSAAVSLTLKPDLVDCKIEALALNAETRDSIRPLQIANRIRRATRRLLECGAHVIYKKIDSTLRGHLRLELDAMRKELPGRLVVLCPAFPANGRTVENSTVYIHGTPLHLTEYAPPDYREPRRYTLIDAFRSEEKIRWIGLTLPGITGGPDTVETLLEGADPQEKEVVLCDAVKQSDLELLAEAILRQPERYLPVGSAGLSAAIATQMEESASGTERPGWSNEAFLHGKVLVVVGSRNPVSRRQATTLAHRVGMSAITVEKSWKDFQEVAARLMSQWETGQRVALLMAPEIELVGGAARELGGFLLRCHKECIRNKTRLPMEALIVTGGETAIEVFNGLNARQIQIVGEAQPGVVKGFLRSHDAGSRMFDGLPVITKAGGFGDEETLARCVGLA